MNIRVIGHVQGVFYRASARAKAKELELRGFVRNESDGSVYAEAEGDEVRLQQFLAWCRKGPAGATVLRVESSDGPVRGFQDFLIER